MEQQQRVTVKQTVLEMFFPMFVVLPVGLLYSVICIVESLIHLGGYKEVWNDIITFCQIIPQLNARLRRTAFIEYVKVPLNNIPCVCVLLVDGLITQLMANLIIFGISNVISLGVSSLDKALCSKQMVNNLSVLLLFIHPVGQGVIANQFVNNSLKDGVEVLDQQILLFLSTDKHLACFIKECITQIP